MVLPIIPIEGIGRQPRNARDALGSCLILAIISIFIIPRFSGKKTDIKQTGGNISTLFSPEPWIVMHTG